MAKKHCDSSMDSLEEKQPPQIILPTQQRESEMSPAAKLYDVVPEPNSDSTSKVESTEIAAGKLYTTDDELPAGGSPRSNSIREEKSMSMSPSPSRSPSTEYEKRRRSPSKSSDSENEAAESASPAPRPVVEMSKQVEPSRSRSRSKSSSSGRLSSRSSESPSRPAADSLTASFKEASKEEESQDIECNKPIPPAGSDNDDESNHVIMESSDLLSIPLPMTPLIAPPPLPVATATEASTVAAPPVEPPPPVSSRSISPDRKLASRSRSRLKSRSPVRKSRSPARRSRSPVRRSRSPVRRSRTPRRYRWEKKCCWVEITYSLFCQNYGMEAEIQQLLKRFPDSSSVSSLNPELAGWCEEWHPATKNLCQNPWIDEITGWWQFFRLLSVARCVACLPWGNGSTLA